MRVFAGPNGSGKSSLKSLIGETHLGIYVNAAAIAEFVREQLLEPEMSFTFEMILSHRSKIDLMRRAMQAGFRVYLYFIATANPAINIGRVRNRVLIGGHDVPDDNIYKSL